MESRRIMIRSILYKSAVKLFGIIETCLQSVLTKLKFCYAQTKNVEDKNFAILNEADGQATT